MAAALARYRPLNRRASARRLAPCPRVNARPVSSLAVALLLARAAPAPARDAVVTSFDGTRSQVSFHPADGLKPGQRAPTILQTHGWGGTATRTRTARRPRPPAPSAPARCARPASTC